MNVQHCTLLKYSENYSIRDGENRSDVLRAVIGMDNLLRQMCNESIVTLIADNLNCQLSQ